MTFGWIEKSDSLANCCISQLHEGIDHSESFQELLNPLQEIVKLASAERFLNYQAQKAFEKFSVVCILAEFFKSGTVMRQRDISSLYIQPLRYNHNFILPMCVKLIF